MGHNDILLEIIGISVMVSIGLLLLLFLAESSIITIQTPAHCDVTIFH